MQILYGRVRQQSTHTLTDQLLAQQRLFLYVERSVTLAKTVLCSCTKPQLEWAGKLDDFMDEVENQKMMYEKIRNIYLEHTKMKADQLDELLKHELWLDAKKCKEMGLIDQIV